MDSRSLNSNQFTRAHDFDTENSIENSCDLPDNKMASTSSSKRSRRATQKRVISLPIKDLEGFKLKGDHMSAPPSDSWAWRKYGQKPIKGSPYPRGYYRCSSSKGCPARKQVERSRDNPNMLVVTYSCEHNHPWPVSNTRNHHSQNRNVTANTTTHVTTTTTITNTSISEEDEEEDDEEEEADEEEKKPVIINNDTSNNQQSQEQVPEYKFTNISDGASEFGWFDFEPVYTTIPILTDDECNSTDNDVSMISTMREEDESLFADLGELPECSTVFRQEMVRREAAEQRPHGLATTN